jgi:hypothetical protein
LAEGARSFVEVPLGSTAARSFLERRLRLYLGIITLISGGFHLTNTAIGLVAYPSMVLAHMTDLGNLLHLGHIALTLVAYLAVARLSLGDKTLRVIDAGATIAGCALLESMVLMRRVNESFLVVALCFVAIILARAIFVPSTARRTAWISTMSALPMLVYAASTADLEAVGRTFYIGSWAVTAIVLGTTASRIIFRLTESARRATKLGQYTLLDRLGGGGMGEVYLARHAMLRRPTAIKLVRPESVGEETLRRFEREVQITSCLTHPNTIAIYDYGRSPDGVFYYAMELLDGVDLQKLIVQHGPMPEERVVHLLEQVCSSLAEAHERGLIHRDVKPGNIVLCRRGRAYDVVKVLDFGLAKSVHPDTEVAISKATSIAGTPLYLAPETIRGDTVDARADLYAIGLVGWFLLTGETAFSGKTVVEVCGHHLHTTPERPSTTGVRVGEDLEEVILRCLEKSPAARFADADALRAALLATEAAGGWSQARAKDWWENREPGATTSMEHAGVLSIDLEGRSVAPEVEATKPDRPR